MAPTVKYSDLTAYFRLQGNPVDDIAGADGTEHGGLVYDDVTPMLGDYSLGPLDKIDDKIVVPSASAGIRPGSGSFSIAYLIDVPADGAGWQVSKQKNAVPFQGYYTYVTGGGTMNWGIDLPGGGFQDLGTTTDLRGAGPTSLVFVLDTTSATGQRVYVNGVLEGGPRNAIGLGDLNNDSDLVIGAFRSGSGSWSNCRLSHIGFFMGYVLTEDDAIWLDNGGAFREISPLVGDNNLLTPHILGSNGLYTPKPFKGQIN